MDRFKSLLKSVFVMIAIPILATLGFLIVREFVSSVTIRILAVLLTLILVYSLYRPLPDLGLKNRFMSVVIIVLTLPVVWTMSIMPYKERSSHPIYQIPPVATKPLTKEQIAVNVAKAKERAAVIANANIDYNSFYLPEKYQKYMPLLKKGAPIVKQQAGCDKIDYADISQNKGTHSNPVFYYSCIKGGKPSNIFLSKSEIESDNIRVPKPIDVNQGKKECMNYAKSRLNFPSTFDSGIFEWATTEWPNGRRQIVMDFTAKNAFGMKLPSSIRCLFIPAANGSYELEAEIVNR